MGQLQALVQQAPGPLHTLAGGVATWMHLDRLEAVRERLSQRFGDQAAGPLASPTGEIETVRRGFRNEPSRSRLGPAGPVTSEGNGDGAGTGCEVFATAYVVVALPDRWRIVEPGHIEVCDRNRSWSGTGTLVTEAWGEPPPVSEAGVLGICLYPGRLVAGLSFGRPAPAVVERRSCWVVEARPRPPADAASSAALALSVGRRLTEFIGAEHRFWFDATTGIVLRHEGSIDGELCSTIELVDVVIDRPVSPREFATPPGAVVRSPHELLRDHLADMGVDPDSVDLDDPDQVRAALRRGSF